MSKPGYAEIPIVEKVGNKKEERIVDAANTPLLTFRGKFANVLSFWQWGGSDLTNNVWRGVLAEYIVAFAVNCDHQPREEWAGVDLTMEHCGQEIKIEVKSSAFVQTWQQEKYSEIKFRISLSEKEPKADVYVFCLLAHQGADVNPLNLAHWEFYVVPAHQLPDKDEIKPKWLKENNIAETQHANLKDAIIKAHQKN